MYSKRKQFLTALRELLCREILSQGYMAEFSSYDKLLLAVKQIENMTWYNLGT